jgi:hypothetical protein
MGFLAASVMAVPGMVASTRGEVTARKPAVAAENVDFGRWESRSTWPTTRKLDIRNESGSPVRIRGWKVGCGCVSVTGSTPMLLAPGEEAALSIQIDPRLVQAGHHAYDLLLVDMANETVGRASISYDFSPPVFVPPSPKLLVHADGSLVTEVATRLLLRRGMNAENVSFGDLDKLGLKVVSKSATNELSLDVTFAPTLASASKYPRRVAVPVLYSGNECGSIDLCFDLTDAVTAEPAAVSLDRLRVGDSISKRIVVTAPRDVSFTDYLVPQFVRVVAMRGTESGLVLDIEISATSDLGEEFVGEIVLMSPRDAKQPARLTIPVVGRIMDAKTPTAQEKAP